MPETDARSTLLTEMEKECKAWGRGIVGWGSLYGALRLVAIVLSAFVAAQLDALKSWTPYLAVLVAVVTTVDSWQKPQVKWLGFVGDRDDLDALLVRARDQKDETAVLNGEFRGLRERHRRNSMY